MQISRERIKCFGRCGPHHRKLRHHCVQCFFLAVTKFSLTNSHPPRAGTPPVGVEHRLSEETGDINSWQSSLVYDRSSRTPTCPGAGRETRFARADGKNLRRPLGRCEQGRFASAERRAFIKKRFVPIVDAILTPISINSLSRNFLMYPLTTRQTRSRADSFFHPKIGEVQLFTDNGKTMSPCK